jgi:hypothetical protein
MTSLNSEETFLYNTGPILSLNSHHWNRRQFCTVTRIDGGTDAHALGQDLACPPCNIGPLPCVFPGPVYHRPVMPGPLCPGRYLWPVTTGPDLSPVLVPPAPRLIWFGLR